MHYFLVVLTSNETIYSRYLYFSNSGSSVVIYSSIYYCFYQSLGQVTSIKMAESASTAVDVAKFDILKEFMTITMTEEPTAIQCLDQHQWDITVSKILAI